MNRSQTRTLVELAILIAIMLILAFTPLGYIKTPVVEITLMMIPVAVGTIVIGPKAGAFLGLVFGLTSFFQCFGSSVFGTLILSVNPIFAFITCVIPRVLCGYLSGLVFEGFKKKGKDTAFASIFSALLTALFNTVFFMGFLVLLFWKSGEFLSNINSWGVATDTIWAFIVAFVGINGVVEAAVCAVVGGAISKAILKFIR